MRPAAVIFGIILTLVFSSIAALPFVAYEGFLPFLEWDFTCILRAISFGIVYAEAWITFLRNVFWRIHPTFVPAERFEFPDPKDFPGVPTYKRLLGFVFAFIYASLYAWKWFVLDNIPAKYVAIAFFEASTTKVFYDLILKQLSNSISTNLHNRQRKVLLKAVKIGYFNSVRDHIVTETVVNHLRNDDCSKFSLMFGVHKDHVFRNEKAEIMSVYEEDFHDSFEYIRVATTNIALGIACIALWMTMIEDYGHAISSTLSLTEEGYLWFVSIVCFLISCFYILCSYNLVHRAVRGIHNFLRFRKSIRLFQGFLTKFPAFGMGILIATTRMNSSYATFGRLAGKYALPYSVGFTLIYAGVGVVFALDMVTSTSLLHHAIRSLLVLGNWSFCSNCYYGRRFENYMLVRYYHLKAKNLIKEANEETLNKLIAEIACRSNNLLDI